MPTDQEKIDALRRSGKFSESQIEQYIKLRNLKVVPATEAPETDNRLTGGDILRSAVKANLPESLVQNTANQLAAGEFEPEAMEAREQKKRQAAFVEATRQDRLEKQMAAQQEMELHQRNEHRRQLKDISNRMPFITSGANMDDILNMSTKPEPLDPSQVKDIASAYHNVHARWMNTARMVGGMFDEGLAMEAANNLQVLNQGMLNELRKQGIKARINPDSLQVVAIDKDGNEYEVEPGFWDGVASSKFEIAGGLAGGIGGAMLAGSKAALVAGALGSAGPQLAAPEEALTMPLSFAGGVIGSMIGSGAGSGIDYLVNASKLSEDLQAEVAWAKMKDAGVADVTMGLIGGALWKHAVKPISSRVIKHTGHAYSVFRNGNPSAAYRVLLDELNVTPAQARQVVDKWRTLHGMEDARKIPKIDTMFGPRTMTDEELAIRVLSETHELGHRVINKAGVDTMPLIHNITARGDLVVNAANKLAPGEPGTELRELMQNYVKEVGTLFDVTKKLGADVVDRTSYRFDPEALVLSNTTDAIRKSIDPTNRLEIEKFDGLVSRFSEMAPQANKFSHLIEMRKWINNYSASAKGSQTHDLTKSLIKKVDREIQKAAHEYMGPEQAKTWLRSFNRSKKEYSKMMKLTQNVLYKSLTKQGATPADLVKSIENFAPALDDTFIQVVEKLPKNARDKTEGAIIKYLSTSNKFMKGNVEGTKAIDFVGLSRELDKFPFESKGAEQFKSMVDQYADIYKGDISLGASLGKLDRETNSAFTDSLTTKVKISLMGKVFDHAMSYLPTQSSKRILLGKKLKQVLHNPMEKHSVDTFINSFPKEARGEISQMVKSLQQAWSKAGLADANNKTTLNLYAASTKAQPAKSAGSLGKGFYYKEGLSKNENRNVFKVAMPKSMLATIEDVSRIAGKEVTNAKEITELIPKLKAKGYQGVTDGNRSMLFDLPVEPGPFRRDFGSPIK